MKVIPEKPEIDAAALIKARGERDPYRFEYLLEMYRKHYSDREIVAAMAASPRVINAYGKKR